MFFFFLLLALLPLSTFATGPVDISADSLEVNRDAGSALFQGNVVVTHGDMRMTADKIHVFYTGQTNSDQGANNPLAGSIKKIEADGRVTAASTSDDLTLTGDAAVYDPRKNLVTLTATTSEGVVMVREGHVLKGQALTYNISTKNATLDGGNTKQNGKAQTGRIKARFDFTEAQ